MLDREHQRQFIAVRLRVNVLREQNPFEKLIVAHVVKSLSPFMDSEISLLSSEDSATVSIYIVPSDLCFP